MTSLAPTGDTTPTQASSEGASRIDEVLRALARAFRAWQLYLPNNASRDRAIQVARDALAAVLDAWPEGLVLKVREHEFVHQGRVAYRDTERPNDGMPWLLYRDGVRELTLLPGFHDDGLVLLLGLLQRARQAAPDDDDVVTMLWVADCPTLRYRFVELGGSVETTGLGASAESTGDAEGRPGAGVPAAETAMPTGAPPALVRIEDFDSALFFLEQRELTYLQDEVRREFGTDPRGSVLAALFDLLETQDDEAIRLEVIARVEELLLDVLTTGTYDLAALALREARVTAGRAPSLTERVQAALAELPARLSEPGALAQLLQAIDEGPRAPAVETLESLVGELRGHALGPLLGWLSQAPAGAARAAVERAVQRLAERHSAELVRHLDSSDADVARSAVRLSAQLRSAAAVPALGRLVRQPGQVLRAEAAQALAAIGSPGALQVLEPLLEDTDRDVRLTVLRAVTTHRHAAAVPRLMRALQRKEVRQADRTETAALFDAVGTLGGSEGVPVLDAVLNGRSLLGPRESTEMRACAARALGLVGSEAAMAALRRSADTKDVIVRNEVARALRGGVT